MPKMVDQSDELARLRAENWRLTHELAEQRERAQAVLENELVGFLIASFELNRFLDTNQTYCEFLGYEREELLNADPYQFWLATTFADDREAELAHLQRVVAGETSAYRLRKRFVRKDGEVRWGELAYSAVRDSQGRVRYGVLTCTDVHDRQHEVEAREKLQDSLFQAQKLETIGRLVGGVAHDFNNRLLVIMGHADILQRSAQEPSLAFHADIVVSSAKRAAELTRQLQPTTNAAAAGGRREFGGGRHAAHARARDRRTNRDRDHPFGEVPNAGGLGAARAGADEPDPERT